MIASPIRVLLCFSLFSIYSSIGGAGLAISEANKSPFCWGLALDGYPITNAMLDAAENESGAPAQVILFFLQWPSSPQEGIFPLDSLDAIHTRGAVPCITWEPMYYEEGREITILHKRILGGGYDPYLTSFAQAAKKWRKPLVIRFAHEMNIERYHWGVDKDDYGPRSPEIYKRMFRYVVSAFRKVGASNVLWAFCPNSESLPNTSLDPGSAWNQIANYYPGSDVVDIVGADGYNWGTTQTRERNGWDSRWLSFRDIFHSAHSQIQAIAPNKPFFIFETACVTEGGDKNLWIKEALQTALEWKMRGIIWFHVRKEQDWRFNKGVDSAAAAAVQSSKNCPPHFLQPMRGEK